MVPQRRPAPFDAFHPASGVPLPCSADQACPRDDNAVMSNWRPCHLASHQNKAFVPDDSRYMYMPRLAIHGPDRPTTMYGGRYLRRRGMSITAIMVSLVIVAALCASAYAIWGKLLTGNDVPEDVLTHFVERGMFLHEVTERGEIESSRNVEIRCQVESRNSSGTAILDVVPEGTRVQEGDILVRLDSSALEQEIVQQQIICNTSNALMIQAQNAYEAAQIAKREYLEGTFIQEEQVIQNEMILAEENLRRAQEYAKYSEQLAARGYVTSLQLEGDKFAVEKAQNELDTANTKLRVLRDYTKAKMLKTLESDIRSSEAQWQSEKSSYELEMAKLKNIEEQIANCVIRAPQSGQVVHANQQSSRSSGEFVVEPGALVRERQVIIRLPDPNFMQVKAKVNEARVSLIREGMPVSIRLDAFDDVELEGVVTKVNEYPEASSWFSSQVKKYGTVIKIVNPPDTIRAGLTAEVRIQVEYEEEAVQVPVQALHEHGGKVYCIVNDGNGWKAREVNYLSTNEEFAVISDGLEVGDEVAMDPRPLLDYVDLPELPGRGAADTESQPLIARKQQAGESVGSEDRESRPAPPAGRPPVGQTGRPNGPPGGGSFSPAQIVGRIIERLDKNKDGVISNDEIPADRGESLRAADGNGDGKIDRAELTKSMTERMKQGGASGGPQ